MSDPLQEARRLCPVCSAPVPNREAALAQRVEDADGMADNLCDALFWISEYPNRVTPDEGQEEHAVELAGHARDALALQDEARQALRQEEERA